MLAVEDPSSIADHCPSVMDKYFSITEMQRFVTDKGSSISNQCLSGVNKSLFVTNTRI